MTQKYNTNLAAEYYVLSMLYRKGLDAHLTLGNKKSIDIIIEKDDGSLLTVDVKGLAGKICWPMDNFSKEHKSHSIVLASFLHQFPDHKVLPECWIIPSTDIKRLLYVNPKGNRKGINRSGAWGILTKGLHYRENWDLLR